MALLSNYSETINLTLIHNTNAFTCTMWWLQLIPHCCWSAWVLSSKNMIFLKWLPSVALENIIRISYSNILQIKKKEISKLLVAVPGFLIVRGTCWGRPPLLRIPWNDLQWLSSVALENLNLKLKCADQEREASVVISGGSRISDWRGHVLGQPPSPDHPVTVDFF